MRLAGNVAHMGKMGMHTGFWWGNLRERDYLEDLATEGRIIFWSITIKWKVMDCIHLADVNMVMNLQVPQNARNFLTSWGTVKFSRTLLLGVRCNFCLVFPEVPFCFHANIWVHIFPSCMLCTSASQPVNYLFVCCILPASAVKSPPATPHFSGSCLRDLYTMKLFWQET